MIPEMICEALENVSDRETFFHFVDLLSQIAPKLKNGSVTGGSGWESLDISEYLESSVAWARDSKFDVAKDDNIWAKMAELLYAGMIYE
jgi:hypothetical protein